MQHIGAILLAAGQSKRMGRSKQLLPLANKPAIHWCLDALLDAGFQDITVVLGPNGHEIADHIKEYPVTTVWNNNPESDMAGSVKVGSQALKNASAILIVPVDHPLATSRTIKKLIDTHSRHPDKIIIPLHDNRKGHPTLFPKPIIDELSTLPTLRDIIHKNAQRIHLVKVEDEGILLNMNTPDDYKKIQEMTG